MGLVPIGACNWCKIKKSLSIWTSGGCLPPVEQFTRTMWWHTLGSPRNQKESDASNARPATAQHLTRSFITRLHNPMQQAKMCVPNSNTYFNQPPIFELCVIRCGSENDYQTDICLKKIGLRAQSLFTILGSIVNTIGGLDDHSSNREISKFHRLLLKSHITFADLRRFQTLNSKLRIRVREQQVETNHLRHVTLPQKVHS